MSIPKSNDFPRLMLRTVFSFMICDGKIAPSEVALIKQMSAEQSLFGDIDIEYELEHMIEHVNRRGLDFFDDYFKKIGHAQLDEAQELMLLDAAIRTIQADDSIKQEEVNFLKILRTFLKLNDEAILKKFPQFGKEFIHKDSFTEIYFKELHQNYFKQKELPIFDISDVQDITDKIKPGSK